MKKNWSIEELKDLYQLPFFELMSRAHQTHLQHHILGEIQVCSIISIKTGGCPEDCKYCAQSSYYKTDVKPQRMMPFYEVIDKAKKAIERGATRVCLAAAWREVKDNKQFEDTLKMVKAVADLGVEVCCTLGMLTPDQAGRLKEAGLYSYNHNLDTSEKFYKSIITTRTYKDRLNTLDVVAKTGLNVCCGAIFGMGEEPLDRLEFIHTLSQRDPHPDSVPLNRLSRVPGTPLENLPKLPAIELMRLVAIARIVLPRAMVRLSSGRNEMSYEEQALCFFAGANSIHIGEKLLTVENTPYDQDEEMFRLFGLKKRAAYCDAITNDSVLENCRSICKRPNLEGS